MTEEFDLQQIEDDGFCPSETICPAVDFQKGRAQDLEQELVLMERDRDVLKEQVKGLLMMIDELMTPRTAALRLFSERLSEIEGVDALFAVHSEESLDLITIVKNYEDEVVEKVVDAECEMYRVFDTLNLEFLVLPRINRRYDELVPSHAIKVEIF